MRTRVGPRLAGVNLAALVLMTSCGLLPAPDPAPTPTPAVPPPTEFASLAIDAAPGLGTGANDFVTGLAASGNTVVAGGTVFGNRLAPAPRFSTDGGVTWQLGRLSDASDAATPPDQGDQGGEVAVTTVDGILRWLMVGTSWRQPLTWTSADGRVWERHVLSVEQLGQDDDVADLAATPEGFVLVGHSAEGDAMAWTSADGVSWRRHPMGGAGRPGSVAVRGSTVVAVGWQDESYATWSSTDRGRTWKRGGTLPTPDDDSAFSRYLNDVTATEGGFAAVGSYYADAWRPALYSSTNGRTWRLTASGDALNTAVDSVGSMIGSSGDQQLVVTVERDPRSRPHLWTRVSGVWRAVSTPLTEGALAAGDWSVAGLVRAGDAWLVAATLSRNGQLVTELWRSTDGRTFTTVPLPDAELNQPVTYPYALVQAKDRTLVVGDSRRRPVVWSRTGTALFGPAQLISGDAADRVEGAAAGRPGELAYGNHFAGDEEYAVVWRQEGGRWVPTREGTFSAADRIWASSSIGQLAWLRDRWVVVGRTSDNGDMNDSALVATSSDGRTWTKGRAARTFAKARGEVAYDVTDLQGDGDRKRAMHGIAQIGRRLLAVGDSAEGDADDGRGAAATVWTSDDARTWTMRRLPAGGLSSSTMSQVAVRGSTVVAIGSGTDREGAPRQLVAWRSSDGGRSWRQQRLDPTLVADSDHQLVATTGGFAVLADRIEGTSFPVLLLSEDGAAWREHPVSAVGRAPGEGVIVVDATADGDDLRLLVRTVNRAGAGTRLLVQPTR